MTTEEKVAAIQTWAGQFGCYIETEGEVGFGRECVGVMFGSSYVDTPGSADNENPPGVESGLLTDDMRMRLDRIRPPDDEITAYHKHDCLCVLGRGDAAIDCLHRWVEHLKEAGARIERQPREFENERGEARLIEAAIHGSLRAVVVFSE